AGGFSSTHHIDPRPHLVWMLHNIEACNLRFSRRWSKKSDENFDERRFSGAVGPEQPKKLTARYIEINATQGHAFFGLTSLAPCSANFVDAAEILCSNRRGIAHVLHLWLENTAL